MILTLVDQVAIVTVDWQENEKTNKTSFFSEINFTLKMVQLLHDNDFTFLLFEARKRSVRPGNSSLRVWNQKHHQAICHFKQVNNRYSMRRFG